MDNTYEQKYLKYKSKYMDLKINGGAWKIKAKERKAREAEEKAREAKEKADAEYIKQVLEAWEKITQTELFRADVEMLSTMSDKSVEESIEIVKNKIRLEEETKQKYYKINSIKIAMDFLGLKPTIELSERIENDDFDW